MGRRQKLIFSTFINFKPAERFQNGSDVNDGQESYDYVGADLFEGSTENYSSQVCSLVCVVALLSVAVENYSKIQVGNCCHLLMQVSCLLKPADSR